MGTAREDFIARFDADVYPYIVHFANSIAEIDADVLMFTARKAACLFDAMRTVGLTASKAQVVSTRVLDMDLTWLAGKRVQLVDDLLVTGSTLYEDTQTLLDAGASSVNITAIAVNTDWWVPELAQPSNNYMSLPDRRALNLCSQIVEAISLVPRPYNLDWPLYDDLRIPSYCGGALSELVGWSATNTATSTQEKHDVLSLTLEARPVIRRRFERETGLNLGTASLLKVRVYARAEDDASETLALRVVPIVAFDDLHIDDVDRLFESVIKTAQNLSKEFTTSGSRLRLVQYVLAARLGHLWMDDLVRATGVPNKRHVEDTQLHFAFSPHAAGAARQLSAERVTYDAVRLRIMPAPPWVAPEKGISPVADIWDLQDRLTEPFRQMYLARELPARRQLKELKSAVINDPVRDPMIDRLRHGISVAQLVAEVVSMFQSSGTKLPREDAKRIVSAYLDIAIDHGVVVPITQLEDKVVRRAYRHGEDIVFSHNETRLFAIMLKAAFAGSGSNTLPKIVAEKLCVLFLRIGISPLNVLERFTRDMGHRETVGVRADLYGAVVQSHAQTMFGSEKDNGLGKILARGDVLRSVGKSYEFLSVPEHSATTPNDEGQAEVVGSMLGELYEPGRGKSKNKDRLNDRDLVLLATCINPAITAAALGAEINIFNQYHETFAVRARAIETEASYRRSLILQSNLLRAIRSGVMKYQAYVEDEPRQIIDRISRSLTQRRDQLEWNSWWNDSVGTDSKVVPTLVKLIHRQGLLLNQLNVEVSIVLASLASKASMDWSAVGIDLNQGVQSARAVDAIAGVSSDYTVRLADVRQRARAGQLDPDTEIATALSHTDEMMTGVHALLDEVNANASQWGRPQTVLTYTSAVYVETSGDAEEENSFWQSLYGYALPFQNFNSKDRATSRFVPVGMLGLPANDQQSQTWVASGDSREATTKVAAFAAAKASGTLSVRVYLIPSLRDTQYVFSGDTIAQYSGTGFVDYVNEIRDDDFKNRDVPAHSSRLVIASAEENPVNPHVSAAASYLRAELKTQIASDVARSRKGEQRESFILKEKTMPEPTELSDIGIVTIIPDETRALNGWLSELGADTEQDGLRYFTTATATAGNRKLRIAATNAVEQGANSTALALIALVKRHSPKVVVLLGIAGGIEKLGLGDVVIASKIIDYGPAADTADGTMHRAEFSKLPAPMTSAINNYLSQHSVPRTLPSSRSAAELHAPTFVMSLQPIGTGPWVLKNELSDVRTWLTAVHEKTAAVETEASALSQFYWEESATNGVQSYLVIRGISDHADQQKNDKWQFAASENAVTVLRELLPVIAETI